MDNYAIAENFSLLARLMDIHGENSFKTRTYSSAAFNIEKLPVQLKDTPRDQLFSIKGIGESVGRKVIEMLDTGELAVLSKYIDSTPPGVIEMLHIKGLGPKKISTIWREMGIESIGELEYACNENRLTLYKGFGEKTQKNVQEAIAFYLQNQGNFLYAEVDAIFTQIQGYLQKIFSPGNVHVSGAYRRQELTIQELEFVVNGSNANIKPKFQTAQPPELLEEKENELLYKLKNGLKLRLYTGEDSLAQRLFTTTGPPEFIENFRKQFPSVKLNDPKAATEEIFFEKAGLPFIAPARRWSPTILANAKKSALPQHIRQEDIKGLIHSHSNWSDGLNTIEEMAVSLMKKGFEYLVISDHSKAAAYANGLTEDRIKQQHLYIDELNDKLSPFRIFKSIECDILNDGSMDYPNNILSAFDLVIASIHSNLKMTEEKAMSRLMKAISNPYVAILGHMTGRLLLSRNGYPVDHEKIIEECARQHVVIELNAHPRRLDMDWKFIDQAIEKGVLISIDPDAHDIDAFNDIKYGVLAAQKSGLTKQQNLSSFTLLEFNNWLSDRKKKKKI